MTTQGNISKARATIAHLLLFLLAAALLAACETGKSKSRERLLILSPTEARYQGARQFEKLVNEHGLTTEQWKTDVVQKVGTRVFEATDSKALWRFAVLDSPRVNAGAMFGELMVVHGGLFAWVENEDQLAAVLGHEAAHITHHLSSSGKLAFYRSYAPQKEIEADRIGLEYAARAGFDPREAIPLWSRVAASSGRSNAYSLTHPAPDDRLTRLRAEAARLVPIYEASKRADGADLIASRRGSRPVKRADLLAMRNHFRSCRPVTDPVPEAWARRGRMTATIRVYLTGEGYVEDAEVVDAIDPADAVRRDFAFRARDSVLGPWCSPAPLLDGSAGSCSSLLVRFQSEPG